MSELPERSNRPTSSRFASLLAISVVIGVLAILSMLMSGLMAVVAVLAVVIGLQYLVWGWWLGPLLRQNAMDDGYERDS